MTLMITIVMMIIVSGITIKILTGNNGTITKAKEAAFKQELASYKEEFELYKAFENECEDTWKYENVKKCISSLSKKQKIGEENCKIGILENKLAFRDVGNKNEAKWAEELGYKVVSEDVTIQMSILGHGIVKGIEIGSQVQTKVGKEFKVSVIEQKINAQIEGVGEEKEVEYKFKGWYKGNKLLSTEKNYILEVTENAEYIAKFAVDGYNVLTYDDGRIELNDKQVLSGYDGNTSLIKLETMDNIQIKMNAFSNCSNLKEAIIGDDVKFGNPDEAHGANVFTNCEKLANVKIGQNAMIIRDGEVFAGCTTLKEGTDKASVTIESISQLENINNFNGLKALKGNIVINEGVTAIGTSEFYGCSKISSVSLPSTLTAVGCNAFHGCSAITEITNLDKVKTIDNGAFGLCSKLNMNLEFGDDVNIGKGAFDSSGIKTIKVGNNAYLAMESFSNCLNLEEVIIGDNAMIGSYDTHGARVFTSCKNLTNVKIGQNLILLSWSGIFFDCTKLINGTDDASVIIGSILNIIGEDETRGRINITFQGLKALKGSLVINEGVTKISGSRFSGCIGITNVTLPSTITTIENNAFYGCSGISNVIINMTEEEFKNVSGYDTNFLNILPQDCIVTYKSE